MGIIHGEFIHIIYVSVECTQIQQGERKIKEKGWKDDSWKVPKVKKTDHIERKRGYEIMDNKGR